MKKFKERDLSKSEALDSAADFASAVASLSSLEKRLEVSDVKDKWFDFERNIGGKLGLEFENPYLKVDGKPLYEAGAINHNLMKKREAERNLARVKGNQKAKEQVETAIKNYEANAASGKGAYFPTFKILK